MDDSVYCVCRQAESGFMIQCDRCQEWFHAKCVGLSKDTAAALDDWSCFVCLKIQNAMTSLRDELTKMVNGVIENVKKIDQTQQMDRLALETSLKNTQEKSIKENEELKKEIKDILNGNQELENKNREVMNANKELKMENQELINTNETLKKEINDVLKGNQELEKKNMEVTNANQELITENEKKIEEYKKLRDNFQELSQKYNSLNKKEKKLSVLSIKKGSVSKGKKPVKSKLSLSQKKYIDDTSDEKSE